MNTRLKVTRKQMQPVIDATFPEYQGRKIAVEFTARVLFCDTNWSGGTCNKYVAVKETGESHKFFAPAPWANPVEGRWFDLPEGILVVERSYFCGKDCGLTIYANPVYAPKLLEAGK